jgi:transcriptional regulator with XRE-family HTH domain
MSIKSKMTTKTLKEIAKITGGELTLGKLIWSIRECEEMTQVAFAERLGISKQHLCDLEHDRKSVSPKLAAYYAEILEYSQEQFIQLALQNTVDREGLKVRIEVEPKFSQAQACA